MQLAEYLDQARRVAGLTSDHQLARALNINSSGVCWYRSRRSLPSDDTMIKIAALAGVDARVALLDLNVWRAGSPETRAIYEDMKRGVAAAAVLLSMMLTAAPAARAAEQVGHVSTSAGSELYIMRERRRRGASDARAEARLIPR